MAQWIRHLTTNQGIPGSSPGRIGSFDLPKMTPIEAWSHSADFHAALPDGIKTWVHIILARKIITWCEKDKNGLRFKILFHLHRRGTWHGLDSNQGDLKQHIDTLQVGKLSFVKRSSLFFKHLRSCGPMDKASDYESGDSRFESWQDRKFWPTKNETTWNATVPRRFVPSPVKWK